MPEQDPHYADQQEIAEDLWEFHNDAIRSLLTEDELITFTRYYLLSPRTCGLDSSNNSEGKAAAEALRKILRALGVDGFESF